MTEYDEFIKELDQLPKIDTSYVYASEYNLSDGKTTVETKEIRWKADTEDDLKENIMYSFRSLFKGKKVWMRLLPVIRYIEEENQWYGRARFAVDSQGGTDND